MNKPRIRSIIFGALLWALILIPSGIEAGTTQPGGDFKISDLVVPSEAATGEKFTITATITNSATSDGNYEATLLINGIKEATQVVNVPPKGFKNVSFSLSRSETGTYQVDLDGLKGSFTVIQRAVPKANSPSTALIIGATVVAALILLIVLWLFFRKRA